MDMANVQGVEAVPTLDQLYLDIKNALARIRRNEFDTLDQWVLIGERCIAIERMSKKGGRHSTFAAECRTRGIILTMDQRASAIWWAKLPLEWRDRLHRDHPGCLTPSSLRVYCRAKWPERANNPNSLKLEPFEFENIGDNPGAEPVPAGSDSKPSHPERHRSRSERRETSRVDRDVRLQIAREEAQREREAREAKRREREEREAKKRAEDQRPRVRQADLVMMYGVKLWPLTEHEQLNIGQYDYDQMFFAVHLHLHWARLLPATMDHVSRAMHLREKVKPLYLFAKRRLADAESQVELLRLIAVCQKLADFYRNNPHGECRPPTDPCMSTGW
jgi:hypothetical protein